jgi:hypothetical protein
MTTLIRPMVEATVDAVTAPWPSGPGIGLLESIANRVGFGSLRTEIGNSTSSP